MRRLRKESEGTELDVLKKQSTVKLTMVNLQVSPAEVLPEEKVQLEGTEVNQNFDGAVSGVHTLLINWVQQAQTGTGSGGL